MKALLRRKAGVAIAAAALVGAITGIARATDIDRAPLGVSGRNETQGFSASTFMVYKSPPEYTRYQSDIDSADWIGPPYQDAKRPNAHDPAHLGWAVYFDNKSSTPEESAQNHRLWKLQGDSSTETIVVPHTVNGTQVGTFSAFTLITHGVGDSTYFESLMSFPLCRGILVTTRFNLPGGVPSTDTVNGVPVIDWDRQHLETAMHGVSLDGYLPATQLTARAAGRAVVGRLTDCAGQPMPGVRVRVGKRTGITNASGSYRVAAHRGTVRAIATAGGGTARSRAVRIR